VATSWHLRMVAPGAVGALLVAVLAASTVAARPEQPATGELERLEQALAAATAANAHERALAAALALNQALEPRHVEVLYQVAREHALLGHADEALDWLERAAGAGVVDVYALREDQALAALRGVERYRTLARSIWVKGYVAMLERPERDSFQKPEQVMAALALRPGERVADIGSGSGYFTRRVARAVGPDGVVWAVDIAQELLDYLSARAVREGLANIRPVKVAPDDPHLEPAGVDTVLMVDTLHYVKAADRAAYARKLRSGLAAGGRVVVIDFLPKPWEERPWGPPPEQRMAREEVDAAMAAAGLQPAAVHDFLPEQFFVEYRVAAPGPGA
jgi:arsenite methyltransferase